MKRLLILLLPLTLLLVAACSSSSGGGDVPVATTLDAAVQRGLFGVGVTTIELVDSSRPTEPNGTFEGDPDRTIPVEVWYPADPAATAPEQVDAPLDGSGGPYPLIVFAHGLSSARRQSASYTQHLASHGYVVAAPDFPLSKGSAPGGPRLAAVIEQPRDVSFVIDSLLAFNEEEGHLLEGVIDEEAIGLTGHSLGGLTTLLTAYGPYRDERLDAIVPLAAVACFLTEDVVGETSVPALNIGGSMDLIVDPGWIRRGYDVANPPRYWVELAGGSHIWFADLEIRDDSPVVTAFLIEGRVGSTIAEDAVAVADAIGGQVTACAMNEGPADDEPLTPERQREIMRAFATPFFDAYLRGSDEAKAFLEDELPGLMPDVRTEFEPE